MTSHSRPGPADSREVAAKKPQDRMPEMRAGRLVMAVADEDEAQFLAIVAELGGEREALVALLADVAGMASQAVRIVAGDGWRSWLGALLNTLEVEQQMKNEGVSHE